MYLSSLFIFLNLFFKLDWHSRNVPDLNLANIMDQSLFVTDKLFPRPYFNTFSQYSESNDFMNTWK